MRHNIKKVCTQCLLIKSINYHFDYATDDICMDCKKGDRRCRICKNIKSYKLFSRNKKYCKQCIKKRTLTEKRKHELQVMGRNRILQIENNLWSKIVFDICDS